MSLFAFIGAIELGLIFSLVALGVYLSFRILNFPDLTVDGSFPLGASISALLITMDYDPYLSLLIAFMGGYIAGQITALLNVKFQILNLLASILVMTALYSINLRIMGAPNISILNKDTIFTPFVEWGISSFYVNVIILGVIVLLVKMLVDYVLKSQVGLAMRATGMNPLMAKSQSVNTRRMIYFGMGLSNGLVAFAGGLFAQVNLFSDASLGIGTIIAGLASVIIGETLIPKKGIFFATMACIVGSVLYRLAISLAINTDSLGLTTSDLNLLTALIVTVALIIPHSKSSLSARLHRKLVKNE